MEKTITKKSVREMQGKSAKKGYLDHRVSYDFLATRESRYQLVDVIDYLFDGIIS